MQDLIRAYPVTIEFPIAWGDMDAFQHVNNVMYLRYFESARIAYFGKIDPRAVIFSVVLAIRDTGLMARWAINPPPPASSNNVRGKATWKALWYCLASSWPHFIFKIRE